MANDFVIVASNEMIRPSRFRQILVKQVEQLDCVLIRTSLTKVIVPAKLGLFLQIARRVVEAQYQWFIIFVTGYGRFLSLFYDLDFTGSLLELLGQMAKHGTC